MGANTNFKDQLRVIPLKVAEKKYDNINSIAQLSYHVGYYIHGVLEALKSGELTVRDKYSLDIPCLNTEEDWEDLKNQLFKDTEELAQLVEEFHISQLEETFVNKKYGSIKRNIEGIIDHAYYHLGQIVLIKKLLKT